MIEAEDENQGRVPWQIEKHVQIGSLIAIGAAILSIVLYVASIKQEVEILKVRFGTFEQAEIVNETRQDKTLADSMTLIRSQLERLESKLDRALNSGPKK